MSRLCMPNRWWTLGAMLALLGCAPQAAPGPAAPGTWVVAGRVELARSVLATFAEATQGAAVSLIDASTGDIVASSLTDASGNFVLSFPGLAPSNGSVYILQAAKGLSVGSTPNRAGAPAVRLRSYLFWNSGWQSFTNSTVNSGIVVGNATTALAAIVSLKQQAGVSLTLSSLIGKVNEPGDSFAEAGTGLSNANDFLQVLPLVGNAIALDQDPLAAIGYSQANGTYALATSAPWIGSIAPALPSPGGTLTLAGSNLDRLDGRNAFWFGGIPASTWSVGTDRRTATVSIPANAYSAPLYLQLPGGVRQTIVPMLKLRGTIGTWVGNGMPGTAVGRAPYAQFNHPYGLALDAHGTLYVTDDANHRICKVSRDGVVSVVAGSGSAGFADGLGTAAQFNDPTNLAFDAVGNAFVADRSNHRIRKITPTGVVSTFAGSGTAASVEGTGTGASFSYPQGIALDAAGNVYVTEENGHRLRKITPAGVTSTLAGSGTAGFADGTGPAAQFYNSYGIGVDAAGNVYVGDYSNSLLRKITPGGVVTTLAGTGVAAFADGALPGMLNQAIGVVPDGSGSLYVAGYNDHRIRIVTP